jgi:D-glycero-D-manno-heptose 1,7-bisphosphate phosphatase
MTKVLLRKAVFFDHGGVLNKAIIRDGAPQAPLQLKDFELTDGVEEALVSLRCAGYLLIVATNQPNVKCGFRQHRWLRVCIRD